MLRSFHSLPCRLIHPLLAPLTVVVCELVLANAGPLRCACSTLVPVCVPSASPLVLLRSPFRCLAPPAAAAAPFAAHSHGGGAPPHARARAVPLTPPPLCALQATLAGSRACHRQRKEAWRRRHRPRRSPHQCHPRSPFQRQPRQHPRRHRRSRSNGGPSPFTRGHSCS